VANLGLHKGTTERRLVNHRGHRRKALALGMDLDDFIELSL